MGASNIPSLKIGCSDMDTRRGKAIASGFSTASATSTAITAASPARRRRAQALLAIVALLLGFGLGCRRSAADSLGLTDRRSALLGPITLSGSVVGGDGLPVAGVTVHLDGSFQSVQVTGADGKYSFPGLAAGSYSLRPTLNGCSFVPDVVNLNNLKASATQDFGGSGSTCGGAASVNSGATSGPLTISGHALDASGRPVIGGRIVLSGSAQALRFTDLTGGYTFHLSPGSYSLSVSGACPFTPANANINNLATNVVQNFTAGAGCMVATNANVAPDGQVVRISQGGAPVAVTLTNVLPLTATGVTARLQDIVSERAEAIRSLTIAGFSAIEREALILPPDPASGLEIAGDDDDDGPTEPQLWLTTAIAAGSTVVRFETQLPPTAPAATVNAFFALARNFTPEEIPALHGPAPAPAPPGVQVPPAAHPPLPPDLTPASVASTFGEISVAAEDSGNVVVYANNSSQVFVSSNGGGTISFGTLNKNARTSGFPSQGDPSMATGAPAPGGGAQVFYYTQLFKSAAAVAATATTSASPARTEVAVFQSDTTGATFTQTAALPIDCSVAASSCAVPDQEQLAADRVTRSSVGDRLYVTWRHFTATSSGGTTQSGIGISCSPDGGTTWSTPNLTAISASGADFPRIAAGPDGSVYVAYETGESGPTDGSGSNQITIWVQKFSACNNSGTTPTISAVGGPAKVQDGVTEVGIVPGLDRRPYTGQFQVAADDSDSSGQRVFVVFVNETSNGGGTGNVDVRFAESTDGGGHFTTSTTPLNRTSTGRRYHPWICSTNGILYVTWYDRRDSGSSATDLTGYFYSSVADPGNTGAAVVGQEVAASGPSSFDDLQCQSGFFPPGTGVRTPLEETACTDLPALPAIVNAGSCQSSCSGGAAPPCGSRTPCDFRSSPTTCPSGESCTAENGIPKYGDYNMNACAGGQLFVAWASSVVPQGINCSAPGASCSAATTCCNGGVCVGGFCSLLGACTGNSASCTSNGACCSGNCLGGTCSPGVGMFASSTVVTPPLTACVPATSTPDSSFSAAFDVDTSVTPPAGGASGYGQANCTNQFLVDVDLTQSTFQGHELFVSGGWSTTLPATPCNEQAIMTVFVTTDGTTWTTFDTVVYQGVLQGSICNPQAQSHTNSGSAGLGGTNVPSNQGFTHARVAVIATQAGARVPVVVEGQAL